MQNTTRVWNKNVNIRYNYYLLIVCLRNVFKKTLLTNWLYLQCWRSTFVKCCFFCFFLFFYIFYILVVKRSSMLFDKYISKCMLLFVHLFFRSDDVLYIFSIFFLLNYKITVQILQPLMDIQSPFSRNIPNYKLP